MIVGHVEKTNDRDYEVEERYTDSTRVCWYDECLTMYPLCRRYRTMESAANRLQKEAKGYLDSLRGGLRLLSHDLPTLADRGGQP